MTFQRYAVYLTPPPGAFADAGAQWLGWDVACGQPVGTPENATTKRPRKYGFHGTIKAPFRLADGCEAPALIHAFKAFCADAKPVMLQRLVLARIGRFLALVPSAQTAALSQLAGHCVQQLDPFRAPASFEELARRRQSRLTPEQDANLVKWGYPHVFDQFKFHMTLTGPLKEDQLEDITAQATAYFAPVLPSPFRVDALTLVGERPDGLFQEILRTPLGSQT